MWLTVRSSGSPTRCDGEHLKAGWRCASPSKRMHWPSWVRARLADYKVPHVWEIVDALPGCQRQGAQAPAAGIVGSARVETRFGPIGHE